jgi:anti-sigma factor RsiW
VNRRERREARLHALHDGELSPRAAARTAARAERSAGDRAELARVRAVGDQVRAAEAAREPATPELWSGIAARLAAIDAERSAEPPPQGWLPRLWAPLAAGAALAAVVGVIVFGIGQEPQAAADVVQWMDTEGAPFLVLDAPDDGTIIWMLGPAEDEISGSERRVSA